MIQAYPNIFSAAGAYEPVPFGSTLLTQAIGVNAQGQRILTQIYSKPGGGTFTREILVAAERRGELLPELPLISPARAKEIVSGITTGLFVPPARTTVDRRSVPREERDPRMPKTGADEAKAPGNERRTGGALSSLVTELKAFFMTPAGIAVFGLIFVVGVAAVIRRRPSTA